LAWREAFFSCLNNYAFGVSLQTGSCGNGVTETPEFCDAGAGNSLQADSACRPDCTPVRCGDGVVDSGEQCDDGNAFENDGCTSSCTICGNGVANGAEQCDLGAGNSEAPGASCRLDCTQGRCGDGVVDPGELCDDGNTAAGDGCRADCAGLEECGDGIVDISAGEGCDDGASNTDAANSCKTTCASPHCGDGYVDTGEQCDDGNAELGDGCTPACVIDVVQESNCDDLDDDGDYIVDEGCGLTPPASPPSDWVAYGFSYRFDHVGCNGTRYVKASGRPEAPWLGVILCDADTYKIMLGTAADAPFYSLSDTSGNGEDHCELVGGNVADGVFSNERTQLVPGFERAAASDAFVFDDMISNSQDAYDCGVIVP
jgi:cysteine-rich repeat protein